MKHRFGLLVCVLLCCVSWSAMAQTAVVYRSVSGEIVLGKVERVDRGKEQTPILIGAESIAAALQFFQQADTRGFRISSIDISTGESLEVTLSDGKLLRLSWQEMGKNTAKSKADLESRLAHLSALLKVDVAEKISEINLSD